MKNSQKGEIVALLGKTLSYNYIYLLKEFMDSSTFDSLFHSGIIEKVEIARKKDEEKKIKLIEGKLSCANFFCYQSIVNLLTF